MFSLFSKLISFFFCFLELLAILLSMINSFLLKACDFFF